MTQTNTATDREAVARIIYEGPMIWAVDHAHQAEGQRVWVPHGNSYAQDEARKAADAILARPTPTANEALEGAVRKALRILHNGDLHEITRVVDAQDALHAALQTTASTPGVTEEAVNAAEKAWMSSMAPDLTEEQLGWLFLDDRHRSALKAALKAALAAPAKGE